MSVCVIFTNEHSNWKSRKVIDRQIEKEKDTANSSGVSNCNQKEKRKENKKREEKRGYPIVINWRIGTECVPQTFHWKDNFVKYQVPSVHLNLQKKRKIHHCNKLTNDELFRNRVLAKSITYSEFVIPEKSDKHTYTQTEGKNVFAEKVNGKSTIFIYAHHTQDTFTYRFKNNNKTIIHKYMIKFLLSHTTMKSTTISNCNNNNTNKREIYELRIHILNHESIHSNYWVGFLHQGTTHASAKMY